MNRKKRISVGLSGMKTAMLTESVKGGKRPLSSSCPYIVENEKGEVVLAGGAAGGSTIISANVQVVRNVLVRPSSAVPLLIELMGRSGLRYDSR